ncbi:MAG: hypothetical protein JNL32_13620, partial [Candidatus Kapabacteria bacterium]|nr:hypothetical protein [Candidatus Kapabacteria bacterium]
MILRFLILLILSLSISSELVAQPTEREWRDKPMNRLMFGVMGNASLNIHRGTLTTTEGILECGRFENATTLGWTAGNTVNIPMTSELSVSPHVYFHNANAVFSALNSVTPLVSIGNGNTVPMSSTHDLQVSLHYLMVDIPVRYFLNKRTFLSAGVSFGTPVNSSFEQSERITSPTGLTFLDGTTTRKIFAGQFSDTQGASSTSPLRVGAIASVGYILPLSESFALTAESGFQFGITSVLQGNSWSLHSLRGGIGLSYILEPAAVPEPVIEKKVEVPPPPPPPVKIAAPLATVDVFNVERGRQADYAEITINQTIAVDVLPLLPYIFFQQSSSTIGNTYHKLDAASAVEFRESQLSNDQMAVYYDVLNIIGARLKSIPDATITVTGCIETEDELRTKGLARKRAQDVARYLTEVWGIAANRIRIKRTMLPAYPSVQSIADGRNENR